MSRQAPELFRFGCLGFTFAFPSFPTVRVDYLSCFSFSFFFFLAIPPLGQLPALFFFWSVALPCCALPPSSHSFLNFLIFSYSSLSSHTSVLFPCMMGGGPAVFHYGSFSGFYFKWFVLPRFSTPLPFCVPEFTPMGSRQG